jgi:hypothetical protein
MGVPLKTEHEDQRAFSIYGACHRLVSRYRAFSTIIEGLLFIGKKCLTTPHRLNMVWTPHKRRQFSSASGDNCVSSWFCAGDPRFSRPAPSDPNKIASAIKKVGFTSLPGQVYFPVGVRRKLQIALLE